MNRGKKELRSWRAGGRKRKQIKKIRHPKESICAWRVPSGLVRRIFSKRFSKQLLIPNLSRMISKFIVPLAFYYLSMVQCLGANILLLLVPGAVNHQWCSITFILFILLLTVLAVIIVGTKIWPESISLSPKISSICGPILSFTWTDLSNFIIPSSLVDNSV